MNVLAMFKRGKKKRVPDYSAIIRRCATVAERWCGELNGIKARAEYITSVDLNNMEQAHAAAKESCMLAARSQRILRHVYRIRKLQLMAIERQQKENNR